MFLFKEHITGKRGNPMKNGLDLHTSILKFEFSWHIGNSHDAFVACERENPSPCNLDYRYKGYFYSYIE